MPGPSTSTRTEAAGPQGLAGHHILAALRSCEVRLGPELQASSRSSQLEAMPYSDADHRMVRSQIETGNSYQPRTVSEVPLAFCAQAYSQPSSRHWHSASTGFAAGAQKNLPAGNRPIDDIQLKYVKITSSPVMGIGFTIGFGVLVGAYFGAFYFLLTTGDSTNSRGMYALALFFALFLFLGLGGIEMLVACVSYATKHQ